MKKKTEQGMMNDEKTAEDFANEVEGLEDQANAKDGNIAALEARITELEAELGDSRSAVLYAQAETQNVRRRFEKEAIDARTYAATGFARDILSVADNLGRALAAIPEELREDEKMKGLITGLEATGRELDSVFARHGISKIVALGEALDPNRHQAMLEMPSSEPAGTIVQEIQTGYMIRDRLLRPALVGVAKAAD